MPKRLRPCRLHRPRTATVVSQILLRALGAELLLTPGAEGMGVPNIGAFGQPAPALKRYSVNLVVDNGDHRGSPVVLAALNSKISRMGY